MNRTNNKLAEAIKLKNQENNKKKQKMTELAEFSPTILVFAGGGKMVGEFRHNFEKKKIKMNKKKLLSKRCFSFSN